jgi:hypothetical protein
MQSNAEELSMISFMTAAVQLVLGFLLRRVFKYGCVILHTATQESGIMNMFMGGKS